MQTYSHFLITEALRKPLKRFADTKKLPPVSNSGLLWGSVMPDVPLILLSIITGIIDLSSGLKMGSETFREQSLLFKLFDDWFFNNPWVMAAQNLFHGPILVALYIGVAYWLWRKQIKGAAWFFWLSCASMLHTLIDILVHHNDGPLVFFPLNWTIRFESPVSYWDPDYYGVPFFIFEHSLDFIILVALVVGVILKRRRRNAKVLVSAHEA